MTTTHRPSAGEPETGGASPPIAGREFVWLVAARAVLEGGFDTGVALQRKDAMRFVITGGSGLIGRALVDVLVGEGRSVAVTSRDPAGVTAFPSAVEIRRWDGASADELVPVIEGAHTVVHLAGASIGDGRWTDRRKRLIRTSRIASTRAVAEALRSCDRRPRVLVQASAVGYYGPRDDGPLAEDTPAGSDFLASVCRDWEAASVPVGSYGVRRVVVRTGVVFAREGGALPRMALPFRLFAGGPVGSGRQWVSWIHCDDEVRAIRFLMAREDAVGAFNLTAPEPATNSQLASTLGRVLRRPSLVRTPALVLRLALGEMATLVLEGQQVVPRGLESLGFSFDFPRLEPALINLLDSRRAAG
jgi:uncharacterized protein (TIGR01777 family)